MYHESKAMFSLGTNEYAFQAKKVQMNDIVLTGVHFYVFVGYRPSNKHLSFFLYC